MEKTHENTMTTKFEGPPVMPLKAMTALPATTQSLFFYVPKSSIQLKSALKKSFSLKTSPQFSTFFKTQTGKLLDTQPMVIVALDQEVPSRWYKKEKITAQKKNNMVSFNPTKNSSITYPKITNIRRKMFKKVDLPGTLTKVKNTKVEGVYINWQLKTPEMPDLVFKILWL